MFLKLDDFSLFIMVVFGFNWATGRASGLYKTGFWFVDGDILTGALHVL